ncbi:MAG: hypothetical protein EAZ14_09320 [Runella slithyformis]|nr:MAG: hypothetical protein EAZ14_09320 [Runella slithyformis]
MFVNTKNWIYWLLGITLALVSSYFFLFPQVWRCQWVRFSDFRQIDARLFVAAETSLKQQKMAIEALVAAQKRVAELWGQTNGSASIILCHSPQQYQRYCHHHEGAGCSIGTPWGESFIVLNLEGLNTDVIAHEMCHDELFNRLGWWTTKRQIPQWFNEGLALMADHRFVATTDSIQRYIDYKDELLYRSHGGQIALNLPDIATTSRFFGGDEAYQMLAYMTAATEVARWLSLVGKQQVRVLVQEINQGKDFLESYQAIEKASVYVRKNAPSRQKTI